MVTKNEVFISCDHCLSTIKIGSLDKPVVGGGAWLWHGLVWQDLWGANHGEVVMSVLAHRKDPKKITGEEVCLFQKRGKITQQRSPGLCNSICPFLFSSPDRLSCGKTVHPSTRLGRCGLCRLFTLFPSSKRIRMRFRAQLMEGDRWLQWRLRMTWDQTNFTQMAEQLSAMCCQIHREL